MYVIADNLFGRRSVAPLFDRIARFYDTELLQRIVYKPAQDRVVAELRRAGSKRVLDVGCGTGILAARIQQELRPDVVYGCDLSPGMLAQAENRSGAVNWVNGRAESLPLPDGSVDAVVSTTAFHFFDQPAALGEFHRVLSENGLLAIAVPNPDPRFRSRLIDASMSRLMAGGHFPDRTEMRELVEAAGLVIRVQHAVYGNVLGRLAPVVVTVADRNAVAPT